MYTAHTAHTKLALHYELAAPRGTRRLYCRKDDRAMRPIYELFHPNCGGVPVAPDRPCCGQRARGP